MRVPRVPRVSDAADLHRCGGGGPEIAFRIACQHRGIACQFRRGTRCGTRWHAMRNAMAAPISADQPRLARVARDKTQKLIF